MTTPSRIATALLFALSTGLSTAAAQGRVWVVDDGPTAADFQTIQGAVDAASDGDVVWVRPGTYPRFAIDDKALSVMAEEAGTVELLDFFELHPAIRVDNLAVGKTVVLHGIHARRIHKIDDDEHATVKLLDNDGLVLFEDCLLEATAGSAAVAMGRAVSARTSAAVVFSRCGLPGGVRGDFAGLSFFGCELRGPDGRQCSEFFHALPGRAGLDLFGGSALVSGCTIVGGTGGSGDAFLTCCDRAGGPGIRLDGVAPLLERLDSVAVAGPKGSGNDCGTVPVPDVQVLAGSVVDLPGIARGGAALGLTHAGEPLRLTHQGQLGDLLFVGVSQTATPLSLPSLGGLLVPDVTSLFLSYLGVLGAGEELLDAPVPSLPPGFAATSLYLQPFFLDPSGISGPGVLSEPSAIVLADLTDISAGATDCNGNGVRDLWEVLQLGLADDDVDGVPNECETQLVIHVDDDAPGDPGPGSPLVSDPLEDGSAAHPFDSIQEAVDSVPLGWSGAYPVVLLEDGTYTGAANRDVDLAGRAMAIRGANGPAGCTIDCQGAGRAFVFQSGEGPDSLLEGLTIVRGQAAEGGAIFVTDSDPVLRGMVFRDNLATAPFSSFGGAIAVEDSRIGIFDCLFEENLADGSGGALSFTADLSAPALDHQDPPIVRRCTFIGNRAKSGGAITVFSDYDGLWIQDSDFRLNHADLGGGALLIAAAVVVSDSNFGRNRADKEGGAMQFTNGYTPAVVRGCTLRGNEAGQGGGGVACFADGTQVVDSILWGNTSGLVGSGDQVFVRGDFDPVELSVDHCDVAGGLAAVAIAGQGSLAWGQGNLDVDPLFASPALVDPHLSPASPCIDAGTPGRVPSVFDRDVDGEPRRKGSAVDLGADEL